MIGYGVVLGGVLAWGNLNGESPWRFLWAVLPLIPMLWVVRAVVRHLRRVDEYQRLLLLQGLGVGFVIAMIASVTVGFLGVAGLVLPAPLATGGWIVFAVGMLGWAVAGGILAQKAQKG
jgi:hypothetical protein